MNDPLATIEAISRMRLIGAPEVLYIDEVAMGADRTALGDRVRKLLAALELDVVTLPFGVFSLDRPCVAILGADRTPLDGCYVWWVGTAPAPPWTQPCDDTGPAATIEILSLLGTGFAQERAGAGFRAAAQRRPAPDSVPYDLSILAGLALVVGPQVPPPPAPVILKAPIESAALLHSAVTAIESCVTENGAIAAAPRAGSGEPDYWYFWQRDAAHVALALHELSMSGDDALCERARRIAVRYVDFVESLGHAGLDPGFSRCSMEGSVIDGYGDPQPDGAAATVLAVLRICPDPMRALTIVRPFADFLARGGALRPSFDLWELTVGISFHAANLARRALQRAAIVAALLGDRHADTYADAAVLHAERLEAFIDGGGIAHVIDAVPRWFNETGRLDASVIGSVLLDLQSGLDDRRFGVNDPHIALTLARLEERYEARWPVNAAWRTQSQHGCGMGRFPEDCNDGYGSTHGSPWPIATLWTAQFHLATQPPDRERSLGYLRFVLAHSHNAVMTEQIDAFTGAPRGAGNLAWANAELITTLLALGCVEPR